MTSGERKQHPSDFTDRQWEFVRELLPEPPKNRKGGQHRSVDTREVLNTILCQYQSGCQWGMIPHGLRLPECSALA